MGFTPIQWLYARSERGHWPPLAARGCRCPPTGAKGDRTPNMVSCPLLTPLTFLWTRLPPVARLNARGPQGRLLLQGYTLDRSGTLRSDGVRALHCLAAHCYARRITQADHRALQRPKICPTHGTEPPFPPFRRATAGSRGAKEGLGASRGGKGTIRCPCPLLSPPPDGGNARSAHRQPSLACGGKPPERRNRFPSAEGKAQIASAPGREHFFIPRRDFPPCGSPHRPR